MSIIIRAILNVVLIISFNEFINAQSQIDTLEIPKSITTKEQIAHYKDIAWFFGKYGINRIDNTKDNIVYRIWDCKSVIELRETSNGNYKGSFKFFVIGGKKRRKAKMLLKNIDIDEQVVATLIKELENNNIENIPNDTDIENYKFGNDGVTYKIEVNKNEQYRFYKLWTPQAQDETLSDVKQFLQIKKILEKELELKKEFEDWKSGFSNGRYYYCMTVMEKRRCRFCKWRKSK